MPDTTHNKINPRITVVEIGIRDLRKVKIYPLSVGHQLQMKETVAGMLEGMTGLSENTTPEQLTNFVLSFVENNISTLLSYVVNQDDLVKCGYDNIDALLMDVDNIQITEIAKVVYDRNFKGLIKNVKSLFEKMGSEDKTEILDQVEEEITNLKSKRQPQSSVERSQATDSSTSSVDDIGKAE